LNILFIANDVVLCNRTGDAIHVREISLQLAELGNKIFIVARDLEGVPGHVWKDYQKTLEELKKHKNITLSIMRSRATLSYTFNRDFQVLKHSLKILDNNKIELIYSRSFNAYIEVLLSKLYQLPLVLEINGMTIDERASSKRSNNAFMVNFEKKIAAGCFHHASKIITVTEDIKNQVKSNYGVNGKKLTVINNGVNEKLFKSEPGKSELLRKRLKIGYGKKIVCFVSSFHPWHGLEGLVEASKIVIKKNPDTIFLMVGEGPLYKSIKDLVKKSGLSRNYLFTGKVPYEQVPVYISLSNFCIAPYSGKYRMYNEYSPLKLYSYLSCARPVITTDVGGVADLIRKSGAGIVVNADNPEHMAAGILGLLGNTKDQEIMGKKGRSYILKHSTWKQTASRVFKVYKKVLNDRQFN